MVTADFPTPADPSNTIDISMRILLPGSIVLYLKKSLKIGKTCFFSLNDLTTQRSITGAVP